METKPAQNIQDTFLNTARKERTNITIYLLSGVKLTGRIRSFDKYSVVLDTNNQEQLIFKHAISTVAMGKSLHGQGRSRRSWRHQRALRRVGRRRRCRVLPGPKAERPLGNQHWRAISIWQKPDLAMPSARR